MQVKLVLGSIFTLWICTTTEAKYSRVRERPKEKSRHDSERRSINSALRTMTKRPTPVLQATPLTSPPSSTITSFPPLTNLGWGDGDGTSLPTITVSTYAWKTTSDYGWGEGGTMSKNKPEASHIPHGNVPKAPMEPPSVKNGMLFPMKGRKGRKGIPNRGECGKLPALDNKLMSDLIFNNRYKNELTRVSPQACVRADCWHSAAIYLCNTSERSWILETWWLTQKAKLIMKKCSSQYEEHRAASGRVYLNKYLSVVASYGRCGDKDDRGPFYPFQDAPRGWPYNQVTKWGDPYNETVPRGMRDERGTQHIPDFRSVNPADQYWSEDDEWKTPLFGSASIDEDAVDWVPEEFGQGHSNRSTSDERQSDRELWYQGDWEADTGKGPGRPRYLTNAVVHATTVSAKPTTSS